MFLAASWLDERKVCNQEHISLITNRCLMAL